MVPDFGSGGRGFESPHARYHVIQPRDLDGRSSSRYFLKYARSDFRNRRFNVLLVFGWSCRHQRLLRRIVRVMDAPGGTRTHVVPVEAGDTAAVRRTRKKIRGLSVARRGITAFPAGFGVAVPRRIYGQSPGRAPRHSAPDPTVGHTGRRVPERQDYAAVRQGYGSPAYDAVAAGAGAGRSATAYVWSQFGRWVTEESYHTIVDRLVI